MVDILSWALWNEIPSTEMHVNDTETEQLWTLILIGLAAIEYHVKREVSQTVELPLL